MKIKTKLTLLFILITAILLIVLNFYIYSISRSYATSNFVSRLKERALNAANIYLEQDEVSPGIYQQYKVQQLEKIPGEIIRMYDEKNQPAFISNNSDFTFPLYLIEITRKKGELQQRNENTYVYGLYYHDNQGDFVILVKATDVIGEAKLFHLRDDLVIGFFFSILALFFIGRFLTKMVMKPVSDIIEQVNEISNTNLNKRLNEGNGKDELAELAITFNQMLSRLEEAFRLQQNFVANASHELRTPLTSIIGTIEVALSKQRDPEEYRAVLQTVLEEAERLHTLSDGLLNIAQASFDINNLKLEPIRIDELLQEVKDIIHNQMPESKMELQFEHMPENSEELLVTGNRNLLTIAFKNLIENANKFSSYNKILIHMDFSLESIQIIIRDFGIGIPEKDMQNVLQTFFRAGNARNFKGSGVGLSLSQKIILLHDGEFFLRSEEGQGTTVMVLLKKTKIA
ncbi:MAG: HAMP domain-containing protein [Bacteroidetes bacterium]|nr:HAMP domain-containing protein [Bacteroidota bacterium]